MLLWLLVVLAFAAPMDLSGTWLFRAGDDVTWADPALSDEGWRPAPVPGAWPTPSGEGEIGWYRTRVVLEPGSGEALGLLLGPVNSAYEVYAGGRRIGGLGALPPEEQIHYGLRAVYPIPAEAVERGELVLALRVFHPAAIGLRGGVQWGPVELGPLDAVVRRAERLELPDLILAALFLVVAAYHLHLWTRRRFEWSYLWFAIFLVLEAGYVGGRTSLPSQWLGWEAAKRAHLMIQFGTPVALLWYTLAFVRHRPGWFAPTMTGIGLLGALACAVLSLYVVVALASLQAVFIVVASTWLIVVALRARVSGVPEAGLIAIGVFLLVASAANDTLVFAGLLPTPLLLSYGTAGLVAMMALSLSNQFARVHGALDALNRELEQRVADRTRELAELNAALADRVRAQIQEILRRARLDRYFSRQILDRVLNSEQDLPGQAQRALVTLIFADLKGFTALSDRRDPEVVHRLLDAYLGAMIEVVEASGATLDKLMGDGVMAILGAPSPLPPEQQARRAVELGLAMQRRLGELREAWRAEGIDEPLALRVGAHQDTVTVGHFGTENLVTYTAIGKGVNLASRLEGACPPGKLLISAAVRGWLGEDPRLRGPQHLRLKGISGEVEAWVVESPAVGEDVGGAAGAEGG